MKNLVNFKVALKTREYLVQAIYQMFFNNQNPIEIIEQFKKEHELQKVDFENFSESLISINKYKEEFKKILIYLEIQDKDINLLDKSIIYFAIYGQILLLFSLMNNKSFLIEISHFIFGLTILLVLFCSFNPYLNLYCYNIMLFTLFTRYIYGNCLFLICNKNNISFLPDNLNYSTIYKLIFLFITLKIFYIFTR